MTDAFKDLFSGHSADYAKYRPTYPDDLFAYFAKLSPSTEMAWDCGTGNGQAAVALAGYFDHVVATDPGEGQIQNAIAHPKVEYHVMAAETAEVPPVDFIGVAQAFHWFRHAEFYEVVKRVAKPDAIFAIWSYNLCRITPEVDRTVDKLYADILGSYWEFERTYVEKAYSTIKVPFEELKTPPFPMRAQWTLEQFAGYLNTWSALKTLKKKTGRDGFREIADDLVKAWGAHGARSVEWELRPRVFKVTKS